ncbi:Arg80p KNAG_0M02350 [Huiozyma naganishii CBS 8797]|uniref:MADS-box domain-containing protein n=1 Tax=Huiozyma naganishii (strain ATCC MYA-139 / BCRC 22969 / CBS 8797 / KCTC 17520 / NBRC 10181 / NCYC 3082 / Yp74L-3) TaxID=1071383 RepID=J7RT19_HUIN7|nr:hypothetical protein KNAG_0M02350 [Kazachstania naganishii CBS 8797]CCK73088.1 hypothetical protein KNAG_0M02350 [Kazachstania naganishii CBS 8797]
MKGALRDVPSKKTTSKVETRSVTRGRSTKGVDSAGSNNSDASDEEEEDEEEDDEDEDDDAQEDEDLDEEDDHDLDLMEEPRDVRRKVPIKYLENRTRRQVTFAKRRHGIMKKAYELSVLTGSNILLLILSRSGLVYTFSTPKLEPIIRDEEGKTLIRKCLNAGEAGPW